MDQDRRLHILVVEDEAVSALLAATLLKSLGHEAVVVGDGASAVQAVSSAGFDLVLLDLRLPDMDGLEVARSVRRLPGPAASTPLIALSAAIGDNKASCAEAGLCGFLAKPLDRAGLAAVLADPEAVRPAARTWPPERFDAKALLGRLRGDEDTLGQMLGMYLGDAPARFRDLEAALAEGRTEDAVKSVHALKGIAGSVGLGALARSAAGVEYSCRKGDPEAARRLLPGLSLLLEESLDAVRRTLIP